MWGVCIHEGGIEPRNALLVLHVTVRSEVVERIHWFMNNVCDNHRTHKFKPQYWGIKEQHTSITITVSRKHLK